MGVKAFLFQITAESPVQLQSSHLQELVQCLSLNPHPKWRLSTAEGMPAFPVPHILQTNAAHCIAGRRTGGCSSLPGSRPSSTGGLRASRWHCRDSFGSSINSRLERCHTIAKPLLQGRKERNGKDAWTSPPAAPLLYPPEPFPAPSLSSFCFFWNPLGDVDKALAAQSHALSFSIRGKFQPSNLLFSVGGCFEPLWKTNLTQNDIWFSFYYWMFCLFFLIFSICWFAI